MYDILKVCIFQLRNTYGVNRIIFFLIQFFFNASLIIRKKRKRKRNQQFLHEKPPIKSPKCHINVKKSHGKRL